jgi:hypothetical protein
VGAYALALQQANATAGWGQQGTADAMVGLGFGRIVASEMEVPNLLGDRVRCG